MFDKEKKDEKPETESAIETAAEPEEKPDGKADNETDQKEEKAEAAEKESEIPPEPETPPAVELETPAVPEPEEFPAAADTSAPAKDFAEELAEARAQIAAYKSGMRPDVVEDAVYLAMRDAKKSGEPVDEETITKALKGVLKRHPEWKDSGKDTQQNGFRVGAEPQDKPTGNEDIAKAFGNK